MVLIAKVLTSVLCRHIKYSVNLKLKFIVVLLEENVKNFQALVKIDRDIIFWSFVTCLVKNILLKAISNRKLVFIKLLFCSLSIKGLALKKNPNQKNSNKISKRWFLSSHSLHFAY